MRKKEGDKESAIIEAAIKVFAKMGFHDAKIHHIADNAGIATGTVYLYFGNKENILLHIFETVWKQLFQSLEIICKEDSISTVIKFNLMIDAVFDYFNSNPSLAMVFVNEQNRLVQKDRGHFTGYYAKTIELIEMHLREGINHRLFDVSVNPIIYSHLIFGGLRHLLLQWAHDQSSFSLDTIRQSVKDFALFGLTGKHISGKEIYPE